MKREKYRFNIYLDGELIAIATTRERAKKVAKQFGGSFRHVARSKPLFQHRRAGVARYSQNPAQQQWVIEQNYSYGWDEVPWHLDGAPLVFASRQDAEDELEAILATQQGQVAGLSPQSYRVVPTATRNPCFVRVKYIVRYEGGNPRPWAIYKQAGTRASRRFRLKSEAVKYARGRALDYRYSQLTIEGRNGEVRDIKYYGALDSEEQRERPPSWTKR